ncbi:aldehyde dehydrogenase [Flammeovirga yaeyamensis]|uniref:Aldehyde dehydrogenase n=1 Tax=Flammeovirga yaeyamensis TaxID=367791 RepID=A0AAX1N962_9BACT|nr:aldehyde dehydrogenase [Flammeovirga yaeyamensis]MBB3699543.1 lactaldehyde dehydrogenase/glycolaldehyde dehydrogenase [Flammeovirga yaeyamensis]NMF35202.1 aldehyde dehydrogenase [Flammeovirga yaeyamensis]QWG04065.1 aldehyde dehydrogenase [Flammeovirga yaeyamensis]
MSDLSTITGNQVKTYQQFIAGSFSSSADHIEVLNPCTEEVIALAPRGTKDDADRAVAAAKAAQTEWGLRPSVERAEYLKKMAQVIRENRVFLAETLSTEQAKVMGLAQVEIDVTAVYFDYYAGLARSYEGEIIQSDRPNEQMMLHKLPIGIAVGITPWNFPFFVMARKIAPSLLTGNACIVKISEETPMVCMEFARLIENIGLPAGILSIVTGYGHEIGQALTENPDVGIISLTGSVVAGQKVMEAAAKNITKVSLELGGKAPAIVCKDADLDLAVKAIVASRVIFSGQVCNCAERVYVEEEVYDEFMTKLLPAMKAVRVGDARTDDKADMSAQINSTQLMKVDQMVKRAVEEGGEVLLGGRVSNRFNKGYYYEPTVIANVEQHHEVMQNETFGPVLPVMKVASFDEALDFANDSEYGLTSSIYTNDINKVLRATKELRFGETYVNRENFEAIQGFHAGFRKSGIGGADGKHGLEEYLQTKVMYIQQN